MTPARKKIIDPLREAHPEPFNLPRTLPGWDLSDFFYTSDLPLAEVNGTAYETRLGILNDQEQQPQNAV
jgi:hypothetical protein